jgi:hypothetical protein
MHSDRPARVIAMAVMLVPPVAACIGCGTDPVSPSTTVTYDAAFSFAFESSDSASPQNPALSLTGEIILALNEANGEFDGTYSYDGHPAGTGTLAGTVGADGTITLTQFGDPNRVLGATLQFLRNNWPNCDFTQVRVIPFSGSVFGGVISGTSGLKVPCSYSVNQKQIMLPTTMIQAIAASPTAGPGVQAKP